MGRIRHNPEWAAAVGGRIRQARLERDHMTQRELAHLVDVTDRTVASWETGERLPFPYLGQLEEALQKPRAWLLYGEEGLQKPDEPLKEINDKLDEILKILRRRTAKAT